MRVQEGRAAPGGSGFLGCLRGVIVAAFLIPIAFFGLMLWLFPDFMGRPKHSYHHVLALVLNHELTGNRHLIQPRNSPKTWCDTESAEDLADSDPNSCALVMYPSARKPFFCPRRSGMTCFEVYLPEELWQREDMRRDVLGTVGTLCDLLERQEPGRFPPPTLHEPNTVRTWHYRDVFSCLSEDSDDIEYHLVVIPRSLIPQGVPDGFDRKHIADHLQLTWTRGTW